MHAERLMDAHPVTATDTETVGEVLARMQDKGLEMLPVVDGKGAVAGMVTLLSILAHIVPNYIVTGDLNDVAYAPDFGLLRRHYDALLARPVSEVLDEDPLLVRPEASLLSVAATLITHGKRESALVVDAEHRLLGIVCAGDVLAGLKALPDEDKDA